MIDNSEFRTTGLTDRTQGNTTFIVDSNDCHRSNAVVTLWRQHDGIQRKTSILMVDIALHPDLAGRSRTKSIGTDHIQPGGC